MRRKLSFMCESCGYRLMSGNNEHIPVHCGAPMAREIVPLCSVPYHPDMARSYYDNEPCDDGWSRRSA